MPSMGSRTARAVAAGSLHTPGEYTQPLADPRRILASCPSRRDRHPRRRGVPYQVAATAAASPRPLGPAADAFRRLARRLEARSRADGRRRCAGSQLVLPPPSRPSQPSSGPARRRHLSRSTWPTVRTGTGASSRRSAAGFGETASYGDIARRIGAPRAARAVGGAIGRNPITLSSRAIGSSPATGRSVATAATAGSSATDSSRASGSCSCARASRSRDASARLGATAQRAARIDPGRPAMSGSARRAVEGR